LLHPRGSFPGTVLRGAGVSGFFAWLLVLGVLVVPAGGRAAQSRPAIEVRAPARVAVGEPIALRVALVGSPGVAGYEAQLLFDTSAARLSDVRHRGGDVAKLGWDVRDLGPVELPNGFAFGSYACPTRGCAAGRPAGAGATGDVVLAIVELRPDQPGPLELRLTGTRLVDATGSPVAADGGEQVVTVQVTGGPGRTHAAPPARPAQSGSSPGKNIRDATGDGRLDVADVTEAALRWTQARADNGGCSLGAGSAVDANRDGCVDVDDVQSFAAVARTAAATSADATVVNAPFTVDSTGDGADAAPGDGTCATTAATCTLRAAMQESNAQTGPNTIQFAIAGTGVKTIQLASTLPTLSDTTGGTVIDGYTQPGAVPNTDQLADNAELKIEVRGTGPSGVDGVTATSAGNTLRGIAFYNLRRPIFLYQRNATGNRIVGSFVGTNAAGTFGHTTTDFSGSGIAIEGGAPNNQVGDTALADRNVISGNARNGIVLYNEGSDNNVFYNNIIGLSPSGLARLPNIRMGIDINAGASFNVVGGTAPGMRNVISGDGIIGSADTPGDAGVEMSHAATTTGNRIVGNFFGTDVTGTAAPSYAANAFWGIHVEDHVNNSVISDNVIVNSLNGALRMQDLGTINNVIKNNRIGVTLSGASAPNFVYGVLISQSSTGNTVGPGNIIANNPSGVWIRDPDTDGNTITQNSILTNSGLGIDLDPNSQVNVNDPGDVDTGSNEQLNFPVITSAQTTSVTGTACAGCTVELFVADSNGPGTAGGPGAGAYGEGRTYLASTTAGAGGQFTAGISGVSSGQWITATATDGAGNTSEFSENVKVGAAATAPGAPSFTGASASGATVNLQWNPPASDGGTAITSYRIYRGTASGGETFLVQVGNVSNYTDVDVSVGTTYWYTVSAVNAVGEGPVSNELSATPGGNGGNIIVSDQFERTVASGLGSADVGGAWSVSSTARTKVQNGEAVVYGWSGAGQDVQAWREDVRQDMELLALVRLNATNPTGGSYKPRLVARAQADARNGYYASISHTTAGAVTWQLSRIDNAGGAGSLSLANGTLVSSGGAGTSWWIRLRVQGSTIQVRYWANGTSEPSTWRASVVDSYFASGRASFGVSTGTGLTTPFPDTGFASFNAVDLSVTP
jgi:Fibronectin type III domain